MDQGWPFVGGPPRSGPRSNDGVREVERSETRMAGHSVFAYFFAGPAIRRLKKVSRRKGETVISDNKFAASEYKNQESPLP
jgi:hypothetical protein